MILTDLLSTTLDSTVKGLPDLSGSTVLLQDIATRGWNLLAGDLPVPVATLDRSRMAGNSRWMRDFTQRHGVKLCPHGKTTMAPQLFERQFADGAWGITVATVHQMRVCRRYGVQRILMANQLVGAQEIRSVLNELADDPSFDFYCLVDSADNVRQLHEAALATQIGRPLQVLLEGGVHGGRTGCRSHEEALSLARRVGECSPQLALCGVEGFEGAIDCSDPSDSEAAVGNFIGSLSALLQACEDQGLFGKREPLLTIGGSIYFDLVATHRDVRALQGKCEIVLRSGCYLTHDSRMLTENFQRIRARTADPGVAGEAFRPALTVWGRVQSMPEPGLAILNVGKRDVSYDVDLPVAELWFRSGLHNVPVGIPGSAAVTQVNDQHAFLQLPVDSPLRVGDLVGLGVSHPCTTFDKWKLLYVLDEEYDVVEGILTFF